MLYGAGVIESQMFYGQGASFFVTEDSRSQPFQFIIQMVLYPIGSL
jgi:hypothetical protein|tara:strand:- start:1613 stop:1750 length:138 start_codon:yes stop_codon:yes gene_type:complete